MIKTLYQFIGLMAITASLILGCGKERRPRKVPIRAQNTVVTENKNQDKDKDKNSPSDNSVNNNKSRNDNTPTSSDGTDKPNPKDKFLDLQKKLHEIDLRLRKENGDKSLIPVWQNSNKILKEVEAIGLKQKNEGVVFTDPSYSFDILLKLKKQPLLVIKTNSVLKPDQLLKENQLDIFVATKGGLEPAPEEFKSRIGNVTLRSLPNIGVLIQIKKSDTEILGLLFAPAASVEDNVMLNLVQILGHEDKNDQIITLLEMKNEYGFSSAEMKNEKE